jgi:hypothetical protein
LSIFLDIYLLSLFLLGCWFNWYGFNWVMFWFFSVLIMVEFLVLWKTLVLVDEIGLCFDYLVFWSRLIF